MESFGRFPSQLSVCEEDEMKRCRDVGMSLESQEIQEPHRSLTQKELVEFFDTARQCF